MLAVCAGADVNKLKTDARKYDLTWSSWADGEDGPICSQWHIRRFPSRFLIDGTGKIRWRTRFRWTPEENKKESELDSFIDKLVREEEAKAG